MVESSAIAQAARHQLLTKETRVQSWPGSIADTPMGYGIRMFNFYFLLRGNLFSHLLCE
jgi:hypothetical protein